MFLGCSVVHRCINTIEIFGDRVEDYVSSQLQWSQEVRCHECVVHHHYYVLCQ